MEVLLDRMTTTPHLALSDKKPSQRPGHPSKTSPSGSTTDYLSPVAHAQKLLNAYKAKGGEQKAVNVSQESIIS